MNSENAEIQLRSPRLPELEAVEIDALADTGAVHMCIPPHIKNQLQLDEMDAKEVRLADGSRKLVPYVGPIELRYRNRVGFAGALVMGDMSLAGCHPDGRHGLGGRPEDQTGRRSSAQSRHLLPPWRGNRATRPATVTGVTQLGHYPWNSTKYRGQRIGTDSCPPCTGLTRDEDLRAVSRTPYRMVEEVRGHAAAAVDSDNMLIQGDNLEALKALQPFCSGRVKCIYIDPPYNTRAAFQHYDDNLEHTKWLSMMYPRLELLRELLAEDGSVWVSIDDREGHYLKVIMDEIFGRKNFVTNVIWRKNYAPKSSARHFSEDHDHVLVYARDAERWFPNPMPRTEKQNKAYKNPDDDPRGLWRPNNLAARNFYSKGT